MNKTLHQFGRVLFDELEQIAVRRGGFASLNWVNEKLRSFWSNLSEAHVRDFVDRLKISGSTRSELGHRARDTRASLKKTCLMPAAHGSRFD